MRRIMLRLLRCNTDPWDILRIESEGHQGELSFTPECPYPTGRGVMPARAGVAFYDVSLDELREMRVALNEAIEQMVHNSIKEEK